MKKIVLLIGLATLSHYGFSQFVAKVEIKEKIEGLCDSKNVYSMFSMFKGQEEAVCTMSETELAEKLNQEIEFLKDKPDYEDKGMVSILINCKGEVVKCETDNKTKYPVLDEQIVTLFKKYMNSWKAGKLNGKKVDTMKLFSFTISKGKITL